MFSFGRTILAGICASVVAGALIAGAGHSQAAPADDVEAAYMAAIAAWNTGDASTLVSAFTAEAFEDEFGFPQEGGEGIISEFIGQPPIQVASFNVIAINQYNATAEVVENFGAVVQKHHQDFRLIDGQWLIHTSRTLQPDVPTGTQVVDMTLTEYAFNYDEGAVSTGNFALNYANTGVEDHEIVLVKLNTTEPLMNLLQSEEPPASVEFIFAEAPIFPGGTGTLALGGDLSDGRYAFVCFFPTPDGTPHAFVGMTSEFYVGAEGPASPGGGGGTITPPSTGDAGMASSNAPYSLYAQLAVVASALALTATLVRARLASEDTRE